jgi:hypothetical protein
MIFSFAASMLTNAFFLKHIPDNVAQEPELETDEEADPPAAEREMPAINQQFMRELWNAILYTDANKIKTDALREVYTDYRQRSSYNRRHQKQLLDNQSLDYLVNCSNHMQTNIERWCLRWYVHRMQKEVPGRTKKTIKKRWKLAPEKDKNKL